MLATTFLTGYGILQALTRYVPYRVRHKDTYLLCGLAAVTVYAQLFSLVWRVGLLANLLLTAICLIILWFERRSLALLLRETLRDRRGKAAGIFALFLLFAYGTSRGILHYDTALYHAQSIRWLEEYGVVRGLGNLHCRLAYNSSSFALSALYSMAFLGGQSFHCAAGWLAFVLAKVCAEITGHLRAGRLWPSDFARVMGIYYLVNIFDEMISPASDYFMVLLAFYIVIRWLELLEEKEVEMLPFGLICVLGVFLMTVKLSAALILLLVQVTVAGSFVFWLCTSPLIRYGCVYVYLTPAVVGGCLYDAFLERRMSGGRGVRLQKAVRLCGTAAVALLLVYKGAALGREIITSAENDYWLAQKDYENFETVSYEIEGVTFYCPVSGDQVGYQAFPSSPVKAGIRFLGSGIADGFAPAQDTDTAVVGGP